MANRRIRGELSAPPGGSTMAADATAAAALMTKNGIIGENHQTRTTILPIYQQRL
jgi:hypothetical protein